MPIVNISQSTVAPSTSADPMQIGTGASLRTGTSTPEGAETGSVGDIFLQTDGTANATLFVKESGSATNTGWKAYANYSSVSGITGTTAAAFQLDNDSSGSSIRTGAGSPEGAVTGIVSDLYLQDNGADADSIAWIKVTGSGNTGWQKIYTTGMPGTTSTTFTLGTSGPKIKNNSDVIEFKNNADNALVIARGLTPVGNTDLTTKLYHDTDDAQNIKVVSVAVSDPAATFTSTATIPANARVVRWDVIYTEAFNNTPTLAIGYTGSLSAVAGTSETDLTSTTADLNLDNVAWDSSARAVICTLGGTPNQGACVVYVYYVETIQT